MSEEPSNAARAECKGEPAFGNPLHGSTIGPAIRPAISYQRGDRIALAAGIVLTVLLVCFFIWRMEGNLTRDWALGPVPASTPTPPSPAAKK